MVRIDRETRADMAGEWTDRLLAGLKTRLSRADAVIVGDYGKGVVTQSLLNEIKALCRRRGVWLSLDPKPVHHLNLSNLSLITPNRKEAFDLAALPDTTRHSHPLSDKNLMLVAERLLNELRPALLLITLGEAGMLLLEPLIGVQSRLGIRTGAAGIGGSLRCSAAGGLAAGRRLVGFTRIGHPIGNPTGNFGAECVHGIQL